MKKMPLNNTVLDEADASLIEHVRLTSILYNTTTADFRIAHKKEKAWEEVADQLSISPVDAKRRWTCLRDRYSRELRQLRSKYPKKECCGKSEFFRSMDFLRPFVKKRQKVIKLEADNTETEIQSYEESTQDNYYDEGTNAEEYNFVACEYPIETYEETYATEHDTAASDIEVSLEQSKGIKNNLIPIIVPAGSVNTTTLHSPQTQQMQQIHTDETKTLQQPETEDDFFCKSVAIYLRKLSRRHKIKAKVEMFQILEKYIEIEENEAENEIE